MKNLDTKNAENIVSKLDSFPNPCVLNEIKLEINRNNSAKTSKTIKVYKFPKKVKSKGIML